jgi:hypothetical protein
MVSIFFSGVLNVIFSLTLGLIEPGALQSTFEEQWAINIGTFKSVLRMSKKKSNEF